MAGIHERVNHVEIRNCKQSRHKKHNSQKTEKYKQNMHHFSQRCEKMNFLLDTVALTRVTSTPGVHSLTEHIESHS